MPEYNHRVDSRLIDDLVTGNLSGDEYRQTLQAIDAHPHWWREVALAFLEEQALGQELKSMSRQQSLAWHDSHSPSAEVSSAESSGLTSTTTGSEPAGARYTAGRYTAGLAWSQRFTGLAALLLISFTLGWFGADYQALLQVDSQSTKIETSGPSHHAVSPGHGPSHIATAQRAEAPAETSTVKAGAAFELADGSLMPIDHSMPDWLRAFERSGRIRVDSFEALMPMELSDGTSAIVPVQQYRVKPVVYSY